MTPRCFAAWSKGRSLAAERAVEDAVVLSWLTGVRTAEAMAGKPKRLDKLLAKLKPSKPRRQTADEMLAVLRQFQAGGAPMDIKSVH